MEYAEPSRLGVTADGPDRWATLPREDAAEAEARRDGWLAEERVWRLPEEADV